MKIRDGIESKVHWSQSGNKIEKDNTRDWTEILNKIQKYRFWIGSSSGSPWFCDRVLAVQISQSTKLVGPH